MKDFFRRNGLLILIVAILLALVTTVVSMLLGGKANPVANIVNFITTPVRNGISAVTNWAEERYSDTFELEQMKTQLEELKKEKDEELTKAEKEEILDDLRDAFRELKMVKEGKMKLQTWEEFKHELGLRAPVVKGHGATSAQAVRKGTLAAAAAVRAGLCEKIADACEIAG